MLRQVINNIFKNNSTTKYLSTLNTNKNIATSGKFETVFTFPFVKYIAVFNRLKLYHCAAVGVGIPACGALEIMQLVPESTFFAASYIGITSGALISIASLPFKNIIGFLYISDDNQHIKISSLDYWGKRLDKIIPADDWIPLMNLPPKTLDPLYLSPQLADGTKYKLFVKFGNILNSTKMGQVLE